MAAPHLRVLLVIVAVAVASFGAGPNLGVRAADPDPLQDFCIADLSAEGPYVNGFPRQDPSNATSEDFAFSGLANAANLTGNPLNGTVTLGFVRQWPALNTLGMSIARLDINPGGIIMPHTHPLATEILFCLEGSIYTDFVTNSNNPENPDKLYAKVVQKGEAFIFPRGLVHFQLNNGSVSAVSLNFLQGQNPGIQFMPIVLFGVRIDPEVLEKSFFINSSQVAELSSILSQFVHILD